MKKLKLKNIIRAGDLVKEQLVPNNADAFSLHLVFRLTRKRGRQMLNDLSQSNKSYKRDYFVRQGATALYLYVLEDTITEVYRKYDNDYLLIAKRDENGDWHYVYRNEDEFYAIYRDDDIFYKEIK